MTAHTPYSYVYEIRFVGNEGRSLHPYSRAENRLRSLDSARQAAMQADGSGLRYGAFPRRIRVSPEERAKARP